MNDDHNNERLNESLQIWDAEAASFDDQPDHGLRDPIVRTAWADLLRKLLPSGKLTVLDIGCGTGSLSLVLAELGCEVTGIDLSPQMIGRAQAKVLAAHRTIKFHVMDAAFPQFEPHQFDVVLCRHILFMLPDIDQVLQRWLSLLKPHGRLILIEGFWHTGAGLSAQSIVDALPASIKHVSIHNLSDQPALWGGQVSDSRYAVVADLS